jgi:hypothetical protein
MDNINIIVSRYNEDLKWTLEEPFNEFKYIVYNKGVNDNFEKTNVIKIINLENKGREGETFLYHIVNNYDNLANINIFFPGSLNIDIKKRRAINILTKIKNNNYKNALLICEYNKNIYDIFKDFKLDEWSSTSQQNTNINNESKLQVSSLRPYGTWYKYYFGNIKANFYCYWGIYSVDKRDIIQHSINRYRILLKQLEVGSNPEVGHYIERSWGAIFHPIRYTKIFIEPM